MKRKKKHFFNMVEVALALLVISLGLSTVLTLFPAGLKATREAEAANDVAEAAEYVFGYLQATILDKGIGDSDGKLHVASDPIDDEVPKPPSDLSRLKWESDPGVYLYRKAVDVNSGYAEDFSCVVQIFDAKIGTQADSSSGPFAYFPAASGISITEPGTGESYHFSTLSTSSNSRFHAYDVELSYPANVHRSQRTKRTYRMVFLDN